MPQIGAVIFDMDGVLIDTEPLWRRVEIARYRELGCTVSDADMIATMGVPIRDVVQMWHDRFPWSAPSVDDVTREIVDAMAAEITASGVAMEGVSDALAIVRAHGLSIAIASSSSRRLIDAVVAKLGIGDYIDVIATADDETAGKPDPAVFLTAAQRLGVEPAACVVIEDSPNGVRAALAAGMTCIAVPDPHGAAHPIMGDAHRRLESLREFDSALLTALANAGGTSSRAAR